MPPISTNYRVAWSVCLSDTLVHPVKAVSQNEMPFGRDTHVVFSNIVLDRGLGLQRKEDIWGSDWRSKPPVKIWISNCGQTVTDSGMVTIQTVSFDKHSRCYWTNEKIE